MAITLIKLLCFVTKWIATLIAVAGAITAVLFFYDLVTHARWGYPWWLLPILIGTAAVAWLLRREAVWMAREISRGPIASFEPDDPASAETEDTVSFET